MTNFERITASPETLAKFISQLLQSKDKHNKNWWCWGMWLDYEASKSSLTCKSCPVGKSVHIIGDGITEPPYLQVIKCPHDDKFYKNPDDKCTYKGDIL